MKSTSILTVVTGALIGLPLLAQTNAAPVTPAPSYASVHPAAATSTDPFSDPLIKKVQARHQKAVEGDAKETKELTADLEKWTKEQPKNYLLLAYLGSTYTLDSRDAWPGPGKLRYLQDGGKNLDAAVAGDPDNPAVRFVRAIDYFSLPAIFGKRQIARDDFALLVKQIEGTVKTPYKLNTETQQAIYYFAGKSLKQLDEEAKAKETWERGLKLDEKSALAVKIKAELADLN